MKKVIKEKEIVVFRNGKQNVTLQGDFAKETIWATQAQIINLFKIDQSVVSRHIKNVFKDKEVDEESKLDSNSKCNTCHLIEYLIGSLPTKSLSRPRVQ